MTVTLEYVFGPDRNFGDGFEIMEKRGARLTGCLRISPDYKNKQTLAPVAEDMSAAVVMLLERGMTSADLAHLLAEAGERHVAG